jgi:tripartite-type tricarboxylate transporter receptor subunit TctC
MIAAAFRFVAGVACTVAVTLHGAAAQTFPAKPIRMIVPYGVGGPTDATARLFAREAAVALGQPIVVDNVPGASSIIGMQSCASAPADGHTICLTVADSLSYNPLLFKSLPYDPNNAFAPVINLTRANSLIVANGAAPFSSMKELVDYSKANPGKLNWGTWGASTLPDVYRQWIEKKAGVTILGVPYKGAVPTLTGLLGGEINLTFMSIGFALPHIKAGKIKPIAVVGNQRSPILPDVSALGELGLDPGLGSYFGVFAPAKTPTGVVGQLNAAFAKVLATPAGQDFLKLQTMDAVGGSPADFALVVKKDQQKAAETFEFLGIKPSANP